MCGRYTLFRLEQLLQSFPWLQLPADVRPRYNIAPTQPILAVRDETPDRLEYLKWGLIPAWATDASIGSRMINARAETLEQKPAFKSLLRRRRCLIPADGFYEWKRNEDGSKTAMHVRLKDGKPFMFAGLWDRWRGPDGSEVPSCTIITTAPNALMRSIHDRMPAIVPPTRLRDWLEGRAAQDVLGPYPADDMEATPVSRTVNNPRNESPDCIESPAAP